MRILLQLIVFTLLSSTLAIAAPFCVTVQGVPPDCIYDDTNACKLRAAQLSGVCTVNTHEITSHVGEEKFCSVDSTRVPQCMFVDRTACENAQNNGAVCVNNTFAKGYDDQIDPFAADPNRNY